MHPDLELIENKSNSPIIKKKDKRKPWPDNNCSNERLLQYLGRTDTIKRVQFLDIDGIGDGVQIYFE